MTLKKLYGQPASFCKKNTFSYDICYLANSWLGSPTIHHTIHTTISLTITYTVHHNKSTNDVICIYSFEESD